MNADVGAAFPQGTQMNLYFIRLQSAINNTVSTTKAIRVRQYEYFLRMVRVSCTDAPYILDIFL
ncbi:MAG TPA: hypothetical protein V6D25_31145 [Leptolyngbyaceae cyanobacterium]